MKEELQVYGLMAQAEDIQTAAVELLQESREAQATLKRLPDDVLRVFREEVRVILRQELKEACTSAVASFMFRADPIVYPIMLEGDIDFSLTVPREIGRLVNVGTGVAKEVGVRFSNNIEELMPEISAELIKMNNGYQLAYKNAGLEICQYSSDVATVYDFQGSKGLKVACISPGEENCIDFILPSDFIVIAMFLAVMNTDEMNQILGRLQLVIDMEFSDTLGERHKKQQVLRFSSSTYQTSDGSFILRFM